MPIIDKIIHISHNKIDKEKWDNTIFNSLDSRIYAQSVWLDNLSPNWNALVLGDYDMIMPLPYKNKWGIKYLAQPPFTQQLGVFSTTEVEQTKLVDFIEQAKKLYKFIEISVGSPIDNLENTDTTIAQKKNYVLDLSVGYDQIKENFSNNLAKKNLPRAKKFNLRYSASKDVENAIHLFRDLYSDRTPYVMEKNYQQLIQLSKQMLIKNQVFVREVRLPTNGELLACGLFFKDEKRIYNIASSTLPNGRTMEANHFLFDELIKEFAGLNIILDFEGSDLVGVERFYKKFGATLQPYSFIKWNNLPSLVKLFKH